MSSRRQRLLARLNWYLQSSLKHITEYITGNKTYYRGGRYRQVSLYRVIIKHPAVDYVYVPIMKMMHIFTGQHFDIKQNYFCKQQHLQAYKKELGLPVANNVSFGLLYVMFTFPTRIFYRGAKIQASNISTIFLPYVSPTLYSTQYTYLSCSVNSWCVMTIPNQSGHHKSIDYIGCSSSTYHGDHFRNDLELSILRAFVHETHAFNVSSRYLLGIGGNTCEMSDIFVEKSDFI